jgi:hypothetical protein
MKSVYLDVTFHHSHWLARVHDLGRESDRHHPPHRPLARCPKAKPWAIRLPDTEHDTQNMTGRFFLPWTRGVSWSPVFN